MGLFNIIGKYKLWISFGLILMILSFFSFFLNLRYSIEFTWGIDIKLNWIVEKTKVSDSLESFFENNDVSIGKNDIEVSTYDSISDITIKTDIWDDQDMWVLSDKIKEMFVNKGFVQSNEDILEVSVIWPSIGNYMKKTARNAIIRGIVLMIIYMLFAFSSLRSFISPGVLALITIFTMLFDVSISAGGYWLFMLFDPAIEVNTVFIIAILTTMWYSINDTIVILDRVRENFIFKEKSLKDWKVSTDKIFEESLWQVMRRSLGTSISTFLVVFAMFLFGTWILKTFALTIWIWIIAGTYSSIFLAAPLAYIFTNKISYKENLQK